MTVKALERILTGEVWVVAEYDQGHEVDELKFWL